MSPDLKATSRALPYRLAAIDIDDTLVGPDKQISAQNKLAVAKLREMGVRVVLASGRNHHNMLPFHRQLGLDDYIVSSQGALVRHAETDEVLYERPLPDDAMRDVIRHGLSLDLTVICYGHDGVYVQRHDQWTSLYQRSSNSIDIQVVDLASGPPEQTILKVIWAADPAIIDELAPQMASEYADRLGTCITNPHYLEFNAPDAHKGAAVAAVAQRYGILPGQVLAFGDGNNDVPMLAWAGMGVAMNDGRPSARAAARRVSPPGDPETALARAIAELIGPEFAAVA